jgi:predicted TIM-barrel fold metal-dependent hydrolase
VIVDTHVHIFPFLGGANGFSSVAEHMLHLQKDMCYTSQPIRRRRDNAVAEGEALWDGVNPGPAGLHDVGFHVGRFGRLEWTRAGVDYYLQFQSPALQGMEAPPEFILAQMDYVGVDVAVLQNAHLYGKLSEFFADAVRHYPNRFVGLAEVDEPNAHTDREIGRLRHAVEQLGLKGLYYVVEGLFTNDFRDHLDDPKFDPYWEEVRRLGIVACWDIEPFPMPTREDYLDQLRRFGRWHERFPEIPAILVHGLGGKLLVDGRYQLTAEVRAICEQPNTWLELLFAIGMGGRTEYPFVPARRLVHQLYDAFGPEKLVWGSDLPNVERFCTYKQSLDYLRNHCTFILPADLDLILGGNAARIYRLEPAAVGRSQTLSVV